MKFTLNRLLGIALVVFASMSWVVDAEARRLGGGRTLGRQSNITQREATPPAASPAPTQGAQSAAAARPGAAQAPARTGSRWMAPIAGLAAGLGLAALANWLGFGEELANFMMIALLVIAAVVVFRMIAARRQSAGPRPAMQGGYGQPGPARDDSAMRYAPMSGQRPAAGGFGSPAGAAAAGAGAAIAAGASDASIPADFDVEGFLRTAKVQFVRLQAAHDAGDLDDLREFTSPEMFAELKLDIDARGPSKSRTDVVTLEAQLLGIESTPVDHLASVRFTGMIREEEGGEAQPFDEAWVLSKPVAGGGWMLAGIKQYG